MGAPGATNWVRRLGRLSDWPLIVKFGVAPALALVLLLVMAVIDVSVLNSVRDATHHIVTVDMRDAARLADIATRFERVNADLNRLLNSEAASPGEMNIDNRAGAIQRALAEVKRDLTAFRTSELGHENLARLDTARADVEQYSQAVGVVTAMLDIDFASAVSMLGRFHKYAEHVTTNLNHIARSGSASSSRRAAAVNADVATTTAFFSAIALLAVPCITLATFFVGLATVRSIREIADATTRLAAADYDLDIGSLNRKDELGAVVRALEIFRTQAIETMRLQTLEEASRGLQIAKTAAESANQAKSIFLANMSGERCTRRSRPMRRRPPSSRR